MISGEEIMFYRCKNCGGNVTYHPEKKKMICESCGSEESQQEIPQKEIHICSNCGGKDVIHKGKDNLPAYPAALFYL